MKNVIVVGVVALVGCSNKEEVVEPVETVEETSTEVVSEETTVAE